MSSIVSQPIKVVVHIYIVDVVVFIVVVVFVIVVVVVIDPRNLPLRSDQNWLPSSWDIDVVVDVVVVVVVVVVDVGSAEMLESSH